MEVHPPDHPIHSVRDFFMHLFTITVGLLIALSLEGLVEMAHNRHLLHTAETNLRSELKQNRELLAFDDKQLAASRKAITDNIAILQAVRAHQPVTMQFTTGWSWKGMQLAAWDTARNTGAIALMSYDDAEAYSILYRQQTLVEDQAVIYIRNINRGSGPAQDGRPLNSLQPAELDAAIAASRQSLDDLRLLQDLNRGLDNLYKNTEGKL